MKTQEKYFYSEKMDEISGFGGGYEDACRKMVIAGIKWCDDNPRKKPRYKTFKNVYGITVDENPAMLEMQKIMLEVVGGDCTGAMMQACMGHVMFIRENGWEKYVEEMTKRKPDKD